MGKQLWLIRHGETEWSRSGQHTSRTDLPLTEEGEARARVLGETLRAKTFAAVLSSPLRRAFDTCRLAGLSPHAVLDDDLREWDYGEYEGLTTASIREQRTEWSLWRDGAPGGETAAAVGARVQRVIERALAVNGDVALFAHGHLLRVFGAVWLGLPPSDGRFFVLGTGSISRMGFERESRAMLEWNRQC
ncbi:MAG: histidine phosphatase family protein [Bryobacterales bacterium]|nr:histidine phosphatase family protein [Bryobacterales bacterium]